MFRPLPLRAALARKHALADLKTAYTATHNAAMLPKALRLIDKGYLVSDSDGVVVTDAGFVTMALIPASLIDFDGSYAILGTDDQGKRGYLVVRQGFKPYHSLASTPELAVIEAHAAQARALELETAFGSRHAMRKAARAAPWYLLSRLEDASSAGLCTWGSEAFLRRFHLYQFAQRLGVPRLLLRSARGYGIRVTAATLLRRRQAAQKLRTNQPA